MVDTEVAMDEWCESAAEDIHLNCNPNHSCVTRIMNCVSRVDKLRLFKELVKYSNELIYTDRHFYLNRVRQEFRKHRELTAEEDIDFFYRV
ncbi:unnamed protein product [Oppiella nova]|uniref:Complex 1 LYR protein domain-containing protein n=1 Tax=Oppiella nova TaxID=334625 RepID=A0A7R9QTI7_9ACAR|nr:unnamed protein product [Oppiella nova]CAG2175124.1 unnamed protein product [Oppiella nova]